MNLGHYSSYRLPHPIRAAFDVVTAQDLADKLGLTGTLTADDAHQAELAYEQYATGELDAARRFLIDRCGLSEQVTAAALARLP